MRSTRRPSPPAMTAAVASLLAAATLTPLFDSPGWILVAAVVLVILASTVLLVHRWTSSTWLSVLAQLGVGVMVCGWWFGGSTFWGLPTWATLGRLGQLYRIAVTEIATGSAPVALTTALTCALVSVTGLIAVAVYVVAIGYRAPGAAGLILFLPVAAAIANAAAGLSWVSFSAPAAGWLLLIGRDTATSLSRWSTTPALALTPTGTPRSEDQATTGLGTRTSTLGVIGLVAALVVGAVLPHLPTRYVLDGLAEGVGGRGGSSRVGYSSTLDVGRSLRSGDTAELLRYRTTALSPSPLRVLVATAYDQGIWSRPNPNLGATVRVDLAAAVPRTEQTVTVTDNRLTAPALATPQPLTGGDFKGVGWQVDSATGDVHVAARPSEYSVTYLAAEITPTLLRDGVDGRPGDDRLPSNRLVQQSLIVDPASAERITALAAEVTAGTTNRYDATVAIQRWLRDQGGFTYSLDLAEEPTATTGATGTDPVTRFLDSRRGYCVQFATTMVMMARARGIPARMAIGFLPGTWQNGEYAVTAAEAHSWPELYFPGAGWVRFEPTPSGHVGSPPVWSLPATAPSAGPSATAATTAPRATTGAAEEPDRGVEPVDGEILAEVQQPWIDRARGWLSDPRNALLVTLLAVVLVMSVLPATAALRRRRSGRELDAVEREWSSLLRDVADLGVDVPRGGSIREAAGAILVGRRLPDDAAEALSTLTGLVERERYARPGPLPGDRAGATAAQAQDLAKVVRAGVRGATRRSRRFRATLAPSVARDWWRELAARHTPRRADTARFRRGRRQR